MEAVVRPVDFLPLGAIFLMSRIVLAQIQEVHGHLLGGQDKVRDLDVGTRMLLMFVGLLLGLLGLFQL